MLLNKLTNYHKQITMGLGGSEQDGIKSEVQNWKNI